MLLVWGLMAGSALAQLPQLPMTDRIYDPPIQTVLLYPLVGANPNGLNAASPALTLNPPVIALDEQVPLQLEFDDLTANYRSFRAKLIHCNADWQRSVLNDIEFTYEYTTARLRIIRFRSTPKFRTIITGSRCRA